MSHGRPDGEPGDELEHAEGDPEHDDPAGVVGGNGLLDDDFGAEPERRGWMGCLAVLVVLALILGGVYLGMTKGIEELRGWLDRPPEDYSGPGSGQVVFQVNEGDSATAIGRNLEEEGVVASVEAFTDAASEEPDATGIQPGYYEMREEMAAADAVEILIDPDNMIQTSVTIPEGFTVEQIINRVAKQTDFKAKRLRQVVKNRQRLGLPGSAQGNPEGYLFPATYMVAPDQTSVGLLAEMVDTFEREVGDLLQRSGEVDLNRHELLTVASIIEKEVRRPEDLPAVAEVVYNRLNGDCAGEGIPDGLLQMDSTVHYAEGANASVFTSQEMRASESEYNTYQNAGLPPGPIAAPGRPAVEAALAPTDEGYCYFVAVNLESGETAFARTSAEHEQNRRTLAEWCRESDFDC